MKRIAFLARDLDSTRIIAHDLKQSGLIDAFIMETGQKARRRKLRRMIQRRSFWARLLLPLDIAFLMWMDRRANRDFYQRFAPIPDITPDLIVTDANDKECEEYLRKMEVDYLLIFGCAILKGPMLSIAKECILNIHGGIVPKYRNVHGEFWALAQGRPEEIGLSILVTDSGIDSGDVVADRLLGLQGRVTLAEAKLQIFESTLRLAREVLTLARSGKLPRRKQERTNAPMFQTPGILDWFRYKVRI